MSRVKIKTIDRGSFDRQAPPRPTCAAVLSEITRKHWKGTPRPGNPGGTDTCGRQGSVYIGDKPYCCLHGGMVALRLLVDAGEIETSTTRRSTK